MASFKYVTPLNLDGKIMPWNAQSACSRVRVWLQAAALFLAALRGATCRVYDPVEYINFCPHNPCRPPHSHYVCKLV